MNQHQTRQILAEIGICDDRQEKALLEMFVEKDEALELERARCLIRFGGLRIG